MKLKLFLLLAVVAIGSYASASCGYRTCGGGDNVCCKDGFGATYYLTKGE